MVQLAFAAAPTRHEMRQDILYAVVRSSIGSDFRRQNLYDATNTKLADAFANPKPNHLRLVKPAQR